MKRSERHHLKQNVLAVSVAHAEDTLRRRRREIAVGVSIVAALVVASGGYFLLQRQTSARAGALLAEAMVVAASPVVPPPPPPQAGELLEEAQAEPAAAPEEPDTEEPAFTQPPGSYPSDQARLEAALPKLLAVADAYPSTTSGITARYHAATTLVALGRTDEADEHYRDVIEKAGDRIYGQMAKLGLAELHLSAGDYESAIVLFEAATTLPEADVPVDAILMRLGRAYRLAGQYAEALQTFTRVVDEFPGSLYATNARQELETLKQSGSGEIG